MSHRLPTISDAAKNLGISRTKLKTELRRLKIINGENFAAQRYIAEGLFRNEQRQHTLGQSQIVRTYWITVVTDDGLLFLREIANALQGAKRLHGSDGHDRATAEKEPNAVHGAAGAGPHSGLSQ